MALLFLSTPERGAVWQRVFDAADEPIFMGHDAVTDARSVTHLACWTPPDDFARYPNLQTVICVGAGVDHIPALPRGIALVRTTVPGLDQMVRDWTVMATLMLHRDMPTYLENAQGGVWQTRPVTPAAKRCVGIMGMGRIGGLVAQSLAAMNFNVAGWSRSGTPVDDTEIFGADGLERFLARSDILICLLPLTPQTRGILNAALFNKLPDGAALINAGRGGHLDSDAMIAALNSGKLCSAMLDVTDPEPLPQTHPLWRDPRVIITPHVAAQTDAEDGARHALKVIGAEREGLVPPGFVDQTHKGY